ncbi:MFS transporter [Ammonifex thiophilus]|uniref:MFS transporter n=1 Tax=Ammonifex thiophilus TaxID=444093 RepID=UPI001402EAF2|nr:MFS transporter [Ammonifex thiophilus]
MLRKHLYLFSLAVLPVMICSGMVYSVLALYFSHLGASTGEIGLIYTTGATAGALAGPHLGRLADRYGRKPVILGAMLGFLAIFLGYASMRQVELAFLIQAVEGAAWAALGTAASAMVADLAPPAERGWAMGVYDRTWFIGWIIGPSFGGFIAEHLGFRCTFLAAGSLLLLGIGLLSLVPEPRRSPESSGGS